MPILTQRATAWIDEHAAGRNGRPFFLYLPLTAPHTPIAPSPAFRGRSEAGPYGDFVCEVDWVVGEILATLDRNGFADDTLVVFTSDNGSPQRDGRGMSGPVGSVRERFGHDSSRPWRGLKSDAWEGGHRVPFVVRWPAKIPASSTSDHAIIHTDLYRTLAVLLDHSLAADAGEDSFDFGPVLWDAAATEPARDHLVHHSGQGVFAIRVAHWKLILGRRSGGFSRWEPPANAPAGQLYDLATDPAESNNLYDQHPDIVARLTRQLEGIQSSGRSASANSPNSPVSR